MNTKVQETFEQALRRRPVYSGCDKELDSGRCNKPVKTAGQKGFVRCADHPVKRLWPEDEISAEQAADLADAAEHARELREDR